MELVGIGNALVDALKESTDEELEALGLFKGICNYIDESMLGPIESSGSWKKSPGGSTSNIMRIFSRLGGDGGYIGSIGLDANGVIFYNGMQEMSPRLTTLTTSSKPTGMAYTFITPDAERTFATYLGAASDLTIPRHITSKIVHIEGYIAVAEHHDELLDLARTLKGNGQALSIDLNDTFVASDPKIRDITELADIIFANEKEAEAFGMPNNKGIYVVKKGRKGSTIYTDYADFANRKSIEIPSFNVKPIDTTAAGDSYAAGFLFGYSKGLQLRTCGLIGSYVASRMVTIVGSDLNITENDLRDALATDYPGLSSF